MLTASGSAPNSQLNSPKPAPTPGNWFGVRGGIEAAKNAIASGNLESAEQILIEMLEFAPSETRGWKLLARTQRQLGNIDAGISSAKRALQLQNAEKKQSNPISTTLAKLHWQQGERKEALEMLSQLLIQKPQDPALNELLLQWDLETVK
ncbi:tetratricopeptide repeat protein [Mariprofundus micogutta]|uniref:Tetratricopeptide repeat protein n=1 Tax=Mariprofundus micogutta TaxID=1921010 RepID=A0A1L8CQG7_9PROT|nr:tetratricopeptide repeat protein [Mariprofundus micogutta]GAV21161.1 tetratricopeptide repeat protein [Mariprofundus micogutta]